MCLPTAVRSVSKSVYVDVRCQWCQMCNELDVHSLFECEKAGVTWVTVGLRSYINIIQDDTVFDIIRRSFDRCNREQSTLLAMVCWSIWNSRNRWVWERVNTPIHGIKEAVGHLLTE